MFYWNEYLAKAIMDERLAEAERWRRAAAARPSRPPRRRTLRIFRLRHRVHAPVAAARHRPV